MLNFIKTEWRYLFCVLHDLKNKLRYLGFAQHALKTQNVSCVLFNIALIKPCAGFTFLKEYLICINVLMIKYNL